MIEREISSMTVEPCGDAAEFVGRFPIDGRKRREMGREVGEELTMLGLAIGDLGDG